MNTKKKFPHDSTSLSAAFFASKKKLPQHNNTKMNLIKPTRKFCCSEVREYRKESKKPIGFPTQLITSESNDRQQEIEVGSRQCFKSLHCSPTGNRSQVGANN